MPTPDEADPLAHGPRRAVRPAVLRALLVLGALLAAEGALRIFLLARGLPQGPAALSERIRKRVARGDNVEARFAEDDADPNPEHRFSHPFTGWETDEGLAWVEERLARETAPREGRYEVWLVGGSVAYGFAKFGATRLAELLGADPRFEGRSIEVVNCARLEFKEPQQLMLVCYLLSLGLSPDAVIALEGFNEAAIGFGNAARGSHPVLPSMAAWSVLQAPREDDAAVVRIKEGLLGARQRARTAGGTALALGLQHSALLGWGTLLYVEHCNARWRELLDEYEAWLEGRKDDPRFRGPRMLERSPDAVLDAIATDFEQSARTLQAICAGRGIPYLLVLQPTLSEGSKPPSAEEAALGPLKSTWVEGVKKGYPVLRAKGEELRRSGIAFEDASDVFAGIERTLYFDRIHFGAEGNLLLAERIARAFLASLPAR